MREEQTANDTESKISKMEMSESTSQTEKQAETDHTGNVRDRPSVLMYLPDDLHSKLDLRFDELNLEYKREHGEALQKNRDFYPAVIEAALEGKDIKDVLEMP
jgi:hypothetical protein